MPVKSNGIFIDMPPVKQWKFAQGMEEVTNEKWDVISYSSNNRSSKMMEALRYCKYFYYSFLIFIHKNKYNRIVAWQQFYGLLLAFYCKKSGAKKDFTLIVMTFIYKRKQGWIGAVYYSFMQFVLNSKYIDKIIVFSQNEVSYYAGLFPRATEKFICILLGIDEITNVGPDQMLEQQKYILSVGRSNRDYPFLCEALKDAGFPVKILSGTANLPPTDNIEVYSSVFGQEMFRYLNNCFCVIIPLADAKISSGQLVALQAMQLGKPIIVTESEGITDYIINGYTGIIIKKEKGALIAALQELYSNDELYRTISQNARREFEKKYSLKQFGNHIGAIIKNEYGK